MNNLETMIINAFGNKLKTKRKPVAFRLKEETYNILKGLARQANCTPSEIIDKLVEILSEPKEKIRRSLDQ